MIVSDIYAFHINLNDARLNDTIPLWKEIWTRHGWTPHLLGIRDAIQHPDFEKTWTHAEGLPTVNDRRFSTANFLRWCAFSRIDGAVCDYDVLPRRAFPPREFEGFFTGDKDFGPGFMVGTHQDFEKVLHTLLNYKPQANDRHQGRPHVSDMVIQRRHKDLWTSREDLVRCYGTEGWRSVPLVHFGNSYLKNDRSKRDQIVEILKAEGAISG